MKISYSAFDTFNRCPLKYKFNYVDRISVPKKPELFFGGLIHEIVQQALKKDPILPPLDELLAYLEKNWQEDIFVSPHESQQYLDFGKTMIKTFHTDFKPGLRNIVATEKRFIIPLSDKHQLSGVIDRIDKLPFGSFEVIDYKTSKALPTQIEVDKDKQLATYNLAVENLWPKAKDIRLTLYFLKPNMQITTTRRPDEVEAIKEELIKTAEKIEKAQEFIPRKNSFCDYCEYGHLCPLMKKDADDAEDLKDIVKEYILAQQKIVELEPKIHKHFDKAKIERISCKNGTLSRGKNKKFSVKKI